MNSNIANEPTRVDTVVIGGGQAGLSIGYHLLKRHRDVVILDEHERVGDAWRQRWESLRLFTPAKYDALRGLPFPGDRLSFPTKDEQADYLEAYATRFELPVVTEVRVDRLWRENDRYILSSGDRRWIAHNVVVATGGCQIPRIPEFADQLDSGILQLHSSRYRNPTLQPGPVLVVGVGNSGAEIALEVSRTHPTFLSGRPSAEIPFRHGRMAARFALPIVRFAGLYVFTLGTPIGRAILPRLSAHAAPLVRVKRKDLDAAGVRWVPRVAGVQDGSIAVEGDGAIDVATVIWCTGYRPDFEWVDLPVFTDEGRPRQRRGVAESAPGLYFLGQEYMFAQVSGTLPGVRRDARYLVRHIAALGAHPAPGWAPTLKDSRWA